MHEINYDHDTFYSTCPRLEAEWYETLIRVNYKFKKILCFSLAIYFTLV